MKLKLKFNFCSKIIVPRTLNIEKFSKFKEVNKISKSAQNLRILLKNKIEQNGPITISDYMDTCLYHKDFGYYTTKEHIFGTRGDFVTAPEVSNLFGSSIGVFFYKILEEFNFPKEFEILEIGAGRGFLLADIILAMFSTKSISGAEFTIVEKSANLRKIQQENIYNTLLKNKIFTQYQFDEVKWVNSLEDFIKLRDPRFRVYQDFKQISINQLEVNQKLKPIIIYNNEFFDALPIHRFSYKDGNWHEILVGLDKATTSSKKDGNKTTGNKGEKSEKISKLILDTKPKTDKENNKEEQEQINFEYTLSEPNNPNVINILKPNETFEGLKISNGDSYEVSPEQIRYINLICSIMTTSPKAAGLIIDYGEERAFSNSFRAIRKQKIHKDNEILKYTGECDLTAYVNFQALRFWVKKYRDLEYAGILPQGDCLELLGIHNLMLSQQQRTLNLKDKSILERQYNYLVSEKEMGINYKFMYFYKKGIKPVYPFLDEIVNYTPQQ